MQNKNDLQKSVLQMYASKQTDSRTDEEKWMANFKIHPLTFIDKELLCAVLHLDAVANMPQ